MPTFLSQVVRDRARARRHLRLREQSQQHHQRPLEGSQLKTAKMGAVYEVNNAAVTCGNLPTANAVVYIIDAVLMPAH
jgi:uncharacterized surface protein with fasciclin (FAS1) repeats